MSRFRRGVSSPADRVEVESVEVAGLPGDRALVRLSGRWQGAPAAAGEAPVLHIDDGMRTHRFTVEPGDDVPRAPSDPPDTWRASFSVPSVLMDISEASFTLEAAGTMTRLPRPGAREEQEDAGAEVDQAVLAERRARRAELAEEAHARRAAEARAEAAAARSELETLQRDLDELGRARGEAERRLAEGERALRAAQQEAFAAEQARLESVEDAEERLHGLERERDDLREELRATSDRVRELEQDVEALSRRAAEAERVADAAAPDDEVIRLRAELHAAEERAATAARDVEERRVELRALIAAARRDGVDLAEAAATAQARAESETHRREELERRVEELELRVRTASAQERAARSGGDVQHDDIRVRDAEIARLAGLVAQREAELARAREALEDQAGVADVARLGAEEIEALASTHDAELERRLAGLEALVGAAAESERLTREELEAVQRAADDLERRASAAVAAEREARDELARERAQLATMRGESAARAAELDDARSRADAGAQEREQAEARLREATAMLRAERDEAERRVSELAQRLAAAREEGGRDRDSLEEARAVARTHAAELQHVRLRVAELEREREAARVRATEAERLAALHREELERHVRELETRLEVTTEGEREVRAEHDQEREQLIAARDEALARVADLRTSERAAQARIAELDAAERAAAVRLAELEAALAASVPAGELERMRAAHSEARTAMSRELRERARIEARLDEQMALADWTGMTLAAQGRDLEELREALAAKERVTAAASEEPPRRRRRRKEAEAEPETRATQAPPPPPPAQPQAAPWLPQAIVRMAKDDPRAAASLIVALAPAQALAIQGRLVYDLTIEELGTYRVTLEDGRGSVAPLLATAPADSGDVQFRLYGTAESLAAAIAEAGPRRLISRRRARISGRRRHARKLLAVHGARLGLPEVARAGVWVDPGLIYKALAYAVAPEWIAEERFTVAHAIEGPGGGTWYVIARGGGERLSVTRDAPPGGPDATVHSTTAAFARSLAGDPPPDGEQPWISGDVEAVRRLKTWTEWAQQGGRPG